MAAELGHDALGRLRGHRQKRSQLPEGKEPQEAQKVQDALCVDGQGTSILNAIGFRFCAEANTRSRRYQKAAQWWATTSGRPPATPTSGARPRTEITIRGPPG